MRRHLWATAAVLTLVAPAGAGSTWYVDDSAPPGGDGTSWSKAYRSLQDALVLAALPGDEVRVAQGTYKPDDPFGVRDATFQLIGGVALRGGFAGFGARNPDARDPVMYPSLLSGDLNGNDQPGFQNTGENAFHVVSGTGIDGSTVLDGFTIVSGNCAGSDANCGGGVFLETNASPTITACRFVANQSNGCGGALCANFNSKPHVSSCQFVGNYASAGGGAVCHRWGSDALYTDCTFESNEAGYGAAASSQGAVGQWAGCRFVANYSSGPGGAVLIDDQSSHTFVACIMTGNSGSSGGAAHIADASAVTMINCLLAANTTPSEQKGGAGGGGLSSFNSTFKLVNCTLARNIADAGTTNGGGIRAWGTTSVAPTVVNCIIAENAGGQVTDTLDPPIDVRYSDVEGGWPGPGNVGLSPGFVDPDAGDFRLAPAAPSIDRGDSTAVPGNLPLDLDGKLRKKDDAGKCDHGKGSKPIVDLGAYEFQGTSPACIADCEADCTLDIDDFICFQTRFGSGDPKADCDANGELDIDDFICFQTAFGVGCP